MRAFLTLFFGVAIACQAAGVLTVSIPGLSVEQGSTVSFSGTLTNNDQTNTEFINNFSITGITLDGLAPDGSPFLSNAPQFLTPGASSAPFVFFDVSVPANQALGLYSGSFGVIGGPDGGAGTAQDNLGSGNFTINVVPEPSTGLLLGGALLAWIVRRRR